MPLPPLHNHIKVQVLAQVASLEQSQWHALGAPQEHPSTWNVTSTPSCQRPQVWWSAGMHHQAKALQDPQGCQHSHKTGHKLRAMESHGTTQRHKAVPSP